MDLLKNRRNYLRFSVERRQALDEREGRYPPLARDTLFAPPRLEPPFRSIENATGFQMERFVIKLN